MNCAACTNAEAYPNADEFAAGCRSCDARALAVTRADLLEDYRGALDKVFGPAWRDGHQLVKRWLGAMRAAEARSTAK